MVLRNEVATLYKMKRKPLAKLTNHLRYKNEKSLYKKAIQIAREAAWNNVYEKNLISSGKSSNLFSVSIKMKASTLFPMENRSTYSKGYPSSTYYKVNFWPFSSSMYFVNF